ncbi:hypothetical protein SAMN03159488_04265 [Pseudomonas sp. NFIX10]|uniref:hypothetical protein n=1 Tax=unclassified Pseudomonas TaxID=196821 RepID=UPI0008E1039C|nr:MULTISPECIES: hypothetical protein [unclassified Pseudomonas]SFB48326.1 hypothetical protein SAMN03159488_04265 [Pseudomonas sp. NFIX10]SFF07620.1 hypothetical protein SAMN03159367_02997 [Pseudomonas sp. NFACC06-1]
MTKNISLVELAEQMGVHPDDLDEHGVLKPYVAPELAPYPPAEYPDTEQPTRCDPAPGDEPLSTPRVGWCPSGSINSGICTPFNNVRPNWMGYYPSATASLRIDEMILPGTHNSAMDKQAPYSNSYETCQDVSPHSQLQTGIRVLDLRVEFFFGYDVGDAKRFMIYHSLNSRRTIEGDCLQAAINLYTAYGNEVVILDFHQFKNFTDAAHRELATIIKNRLGSRLIEPKWNVLSLRQLWALQKNVVIAYNHSQRDPLFWPGVNHRWIQKDTPSSSELKSFIDQVGNEIKPEYELRSIQAHKYTKVGQPDDMSPDVMNWFAAGADDSPIMKFYIINTDWSLRHRHIDNCIHANSFRSKGRTSLYLTPQNLPANGYIPHGHQAIAVETYDGNWIDTMRLPASGLRNATLLIICKAQWNTNLQVTNSNIPTGSMILAQGNILLFMYDSSQGKWILQPAAVYSPNTSGDNIPAVRADEKFISYRTEDYNWTDHIYLPSSAPIYSYVEISSEITATEGWHSEIHRRPDQRVYRCQRGDRYLFMLNSQLTWEAVKTAIHSYGAAQAGAQMIDTGTEETRVHFRDGDWVREITLPVTAWQDDEVILTSNATLTATVMGSNLETGASVQLKKGDTLVFRYIASTRKWRRHLSASEESAAED